MSEPMSCRLSTAEFPDMLPGGSADTGEAGTLSGRSGQPAPHVKAAGICPAASQQAPQGRAVGLTFSLTEAQCSALSFAALCEAEELAAGYEAHIPEMQEGHPATLGSPQHPRRGASMSRRKTPCRWIEPQDFRDLRRQAGLTRLQAAKALDVTGRTIQNWETGGARTPWMAHRMLRILRGYALPGKRMSTNGCELKLIGTHTNNVTLRLH